MHDRTKRLLCRAGFLALCILPTATVWAWTSSWQGASHRAAVAAQLSQNLGLRTTLADVAYPKPGLTLLEGLQLADPETGLPLVQMRFLEAGGGERTAALVASQPEIDAAQLARLWRVVDARLRESVDSQPLVRLAASEVTLHLPDGSQTLTEFLGQLDTRSSSTERVVSINFRLAGAAAADPIRIRYARRVADDALPTAHRPLPTARVATLVELHTGGEAVPVWLLAGPLGIAHHLGPHARFRGSIWASETSEGWEGEISGQLLDVDLQSLVSEQFPHRLSGPAEITIQNARIHRGRLEEASGMLTAGPGVVSRSLLAAAVESLHWISGDAAAKVAPLEQYEQLALRFTIDAGGLTVRGQCPGAAGAILTSRNGIVLSESGAAAVPVVALLRTLVPQSEVQAPATRESSWLIGRLPVPEVMPPTGTSPEGRLRMPLDQ